jgi:hypothetical protein
LNGDIATVYKAGFVKSLSKPDYMRGAEFRSAMEKPNHRRRNLLRVRRERQRRRAAK